MTATAPRAADAAPAPHEAIWALATALVPSRALHLAAELGVADHIAEEPVAADELARRCGADPLALDRVLRLLVANGIFDLDDAGYRHSPASRFLRDDHPMSMRAFARLLSLPVTWGGIGALGHAARTGQPGVETVDERGLFPYLQAHPAEQRVFGEAMASKSRADIVAVLHAYDFRPFRTIADIGGGTGHLLRAVLDSAPDARGVLFDLPDVVARVEVGSERLTVQPGDFFADPLPGADAYLLMEVLHDWRDPEAVDVLEAVRRAARPGATVLIIEDVAPDDAIDARVHTLDVLMLAVTGGRERTVSEMAGLLDRSGFRLTSTIATPGPMRIVEGVAI